MTLCWAEARRAAYAAAVPPPAAEVPLGEAGGSTLAAPLRARTPVPGFDCSAMDGYAVGSPTGPWRLVGLVLAGQRPAAPVRPGEAVEVATGAPVPPGTVAVLPAEHAERSGDKVAAAGPVRPGRHVRRTGEDIPAGAELLPAGTPVTPTAIGLAAAVGLDSLSTTRRPRVALLVTGAELVRVGGSRDGLVRDAVGPALPGWVRALGGDPLPLAVVPDTGPAALADAVRAAGGDVVVTSGGAGVGPVDQVRPALRALGARDLVDGVDCRPGRPQRLAGLPDGRWLVALPGSPYAGLVAVLTLLGPLLAGLAGRALPELPTAELVQAGPGADRPGGATRVIPVRRHGPGAVRPVGLDRPGNLWGPALADAFAVVPPGWAPGERVGLLPAPGEPG